MVYMLLVNWLMLERTTLKTAPSSSICDAQFVRFAATIGIGLDNVLGGDSVVLPLPGASVRERCERLHGQFHVASLIKHSNSVTRVHWVAWLSLQRVLSAWHYFRVVFMIALDKNLAHECPSHCDPNRVLMYPVHGHLT